MGIKAPYPPNGPYDAGGAEAVDGCRVRVGLGLRVYRVWAGVETSFRFMHSSLVMWVEQSSLRFKTVSAE